MILKRTLSRIAFKSAIALVVTLSCLTQVQAQEDKLTVINSYIDDLFTYNKAMGSFTILDKGNVVLDKQTGYSNRKVGLLASRGYVPADSSSPYKVASISKTMTATMVMQLIEANKLSLNTKLNDFFPEISNAENISIRDLLQHRSGLVNFIDEPDFLSYYTKPQTQAQMIARLAALPSNFPPGSQYEYSNANYLLLGYIIEKVTGKSFDEVLRAQITQPLNLTHTQYCLDLKACDIHITSFYYWNNAWVAITPHWSPTVTGAAASITSTTLDVSRFIRALFQGDLLPKEAVQMMTKEYFGIYSPKYSRLERYGHDGILEGYRSSMLYFPKQDVAIVISINGLHETYDDIVRNIVGLYFDEKVELPDYDRPNMTMNEGQLKAFTGTYKALDGKKVVEVFIDDGALKAQMVGQPSFTFIPMTENEFENKAFGIILTFSPVKNEQGKTNNVKAKSGNHTETYYRLRSSK